MKYVLEYDSLCRSQKELNKKKKKKIVCTKKKNRIVNFFFLIEYLETKCNHPNKERDQKMEKHVVHATAYH
jgi:hypothetical protein